jgi:hypothetical protein
MTSSASSSAVWAAVMPFKTVFCPNWTRMTFLSGWSTRDDMFREMGRKQKKASRSQGSKQGKLTAVNGLDTVGPYDNAM